jgi:pyruvate-formate lyase-activating enzyme
MKLEKIGFYTMSDERAARAGEGPLARCELLITSACNFACPYCRGAKPELRGKMRRREWEPILKAWVAEGLQNVRFSGGEPTLHPELLEMVRYVKACGAHRIAISSNGSAAWEVYERLLEAGVDDFSISLDACCASTGDEMAGGISGAWAKVTEAIRRLSERAYVTVGVVLTEDNLAEMHRTIDLAHKLGVADIRIISAAQHNQQPRIDVPEEILARHPILKYRSEGRRVRGLEPTDCGKCHLVKDDMAVAGKWHFPCIIYLREGGAPIGLMGPDARRQRTKWFEKHDSHRDDICRRNCLDVCVDYNNRVRDLAKELGPGARARRP